MSRAPTQTGRSAPSRRQSVDDWEEWEDEDVVTPIDPEEQVLIQGPSSCSNLAVPTTTRSTNSRISRPPSTRLKRLKSRHRQKAQNAKAGIKLITDMTTLRFQSHVASQLKTPDGRPVKFVDAAALKALEGEPTSASVGNWNWLKRGKSPNSATPKSSARSPQNELTPGDAPIMIGFALSPDHTVQESGISSATPTAGPSTNATAQQKSVTDNNQVPQEQQVSMWSPDTPDTISSNNFRPASSVYSQATNLCAPKKHVVEEVPPVPAVPSNYKKAPHQRLISLEVGANGADDDLDTPCTLFEEDGSPSSQKQPRSRGLGLSPDSAGSRGNGWWDHVVTPFLDKRFTLSSLKTKNESPKGLSPADHTRDSPIVGVYDEKKSSPALLPVPKVGPPPIVRAPTPRRTPTPPSTEPLSACDSSPESSPVVDRAAISEKPHIIVTPEIPSASEIPPPYCSPRSYEHSKQDRPIRYRAVFPPGHPLHAQFPPTPQPGSPGPGSPGLAATMTSQGATAMTDIPITPTVPREMPLPNRPIGTSLPQEHSHDARGGEHRVERQRRRHEKEEVVARKMGGFWRGRGCVPSSGCFGRTGREGRKRRRWCIGILGALVALIILAVILGVVLTRPRHSKEIPSIWVNLTDYPPMPTGVLTVVGSDNTAANSGCTRPTTAWSCSLPKDDQDSVAPYQPDQPTFIMQIQWDNSTSETWKVPNGDAPKSVSRRAAGGPAHASSVLRDRAADKFTPDPSPPDYEEMWFLGDTTDDTKAKDKAGEPAPFYISLLKSKKDKVEDPDLSKRQTTVGGSFVKDLVSPPDLLNDGTPAPATMLPQPVQQPVRLYDRGLPTEHYGFYTYFKRTIYLKSTDDSDDPVPLDKDGGCKKSEANYLVTWAETRMLVQMWTKTLDSDHAKLLARGSSKSIDGSPELIRPGTMPYPVTVTLDTHGGDIDKKYVWEWPMNERQKLDLENPKLLGNNVGFGGDLINPRKDNDTSYGGFDGGSGGCKCEWVNWT